MDSAPAKAPSAARAAQPTRPLTDAPRKSPRPTVATVGAAAAASFSSFPSSSAGVDSSGGESGGTGCRGGAIVVADAAHLWNEVTSALALGSDSSGGGGSGGGGGGSGGRRPTDAPRKSPRPSPLVFQRKSPSPLAAALASSRAAPHPDGSPFGGSQPGGSAMAQAHHLLSDSSVQDNDPEALESDSENDDDDDDDDTVLNSGGIGGSASGSGSGRLTPTLSSRSLLAALQVPSAVAE